MVHKRETFVQRHKDTLKELTLVLTRSKHETIPRWKVITNCEKLETLKVVFGRIRPEDWTSCWSSWRRLRSLEVKFVRFQKPVLVAENDANYVDDSTTTSSQEISNSVDHQSKSSGNNTLVQEIIGPIVWDWPDFGNLAPAIRLRHISLVSLVGLSVANQLSIIQQCPRIESLRWNFSTAHEHIPLLDMAESIHQETWPCLVDLNLMGGVSSDAEVARMLMAFDQGLHRLSLINSGIAKQSVDALLYSRTKSPGAIGRGMATLPPHAQSLVQLELGLCRFITSSMAQKIMQSCPHLKVLQVVYLADKDILYQHKDDEEQEEQQRAGAPEEAAPWVCTKLERLQLSRIDMTVATGETNNPVSPHNGMVLDRLAQLTQLRHLSLRDCNEFGTAAAEPGRTLVLSLDHGLEKLAHLKDLTMVSFDGKRQDMHEQDLRWMARTWPKLTSLEGVIHATPGAIQELTDWFDNRGVTWYSIE